MTDSQTTDELREKLEGDISRFSEMYAILGTNDSIREHAIGWIDRQAAITERECADRYVNTWTEGSVAWILRQYEDEKLMRDVDCEARIALETEELQDRIEELEGKVDELENGVKATLQQLDALIVGGYDLKDVCAWIDGQLEES